MKAVFAFFVDNYKLSWLLTGLIVFMALLGMNLIKRESRPPVDFARVSITTFYPGASPEEVEDQVTTRIEEELRSIEGVKDIKSVSGTGKSDIVVRLDLDHGSTQTTQDEIHRAIQRVRGLPSDIKDLPTVRIANAKEIPIVELALVGPNDSRQRDRMANDLRLLLEDEKGVAEVVLSGYREREFQILLKPQLMQSLHVGISEVVDAVKRRTQNIPAGFIRTIDNQRLVRVTGQIRSAQEMGDIIVRGNFDGQNVRIRDVAEVVDGMEDTSVLVRVNSEPATLLTVTKRADADAIRVVDRLKKRLEDFRRDKLPPGFTLINYNDEAKRIAERLNIVISNTLQGLILVLVILLLFLPGTLGFLTSLSLPLATLGTVAIMPLIGVNFNNITMLALVIAIGMLVDNSVVISEYYARLRAGGMPRNQAAVKAGHQFWMPLSATVLTTIAAFLPMLVTKGVMGQFIRWIPIVVTISLVMSLIESFFLLPSRLQFCLLTEPKSDSATNPKRTWFEPLKQKFESTMSVCVARRYAVAGGLGLLLLSSFAVAVFGNRFELFPAEDVEQYVASYTAPITTNLKSMDAITKRLSEEARTMIGSEAIDYVIARSGVSRRSGSESSVTGDYVGMMVITVTPEAARTLDPQETLQKLRTINKGELEQLSFEVSRHGPPVGAALSATFRSKNYEQLKGMVTSFQERLAKIEGVVDVENDEVRGGPEYRIVPNHNIIAGLNLDVQTIGMALRTALQGAIASELSLDGDDFDLRVRYDDQHRETFEALRDTTIMERTGKLIPLSSLVRIDETEGPAVRKHYDFKRSINVSSGVVPSQITSLELNQRAQAIVGSLSSTYPAVSSTFGGEQESTQESMTSLRQALLLSLIGIFAILVVLYRSFSHSLLVLTSIPLGLIGVCWAFFLHGKPLSFLAMIGTIGLAGVVVNSAIVLVSYINEMRLDHPELTLVGILARSSSDRLRAVMVTSLTTVGGLIPTAYGWGGYERMLVPMTLALAWGLAAGTFLTLVWIPCGYAIIIDIENWLHQRFGAYFSRFAMTDSSLPALTNDLTVSPSSASLSRLEDHQHDLTI